MDYVLGFLFSKDRVLLIKKAKPKWQVGKLNGIGGKMRPFETLQGAMQRECLEETGINIDTNAWEHCITMHVCNLENTVYIFRAYVEFSTLHQVDLNKSDNPDEELCVCRKADPENNFFDAPLIPNLKWIIPMLLDKDITVPLNITYHQSLGIA